jgi:hypothetical protein
LGEMMRVTRDGGTVAACVWDFTGGMTMLRAYWDSAREVDPNAPDEIQRFGAGQAARGLVARGGASRRHGLFARYLVSRYNDFDELWQSFLAVPRGRLEPTPHRWTRRAARRCVGRFASASGPPWPVRVTARAWCAVGVVSAFRGRWRRGHGAESGPKGWLHL